MGDVRRFKACVACSLRSRLGKDPTLNQFPPFVIVVPRKRALSMIPQCGIQSAKFWVQGVRGRFGRLGLKATKGGYKKTGLGLRVEESRAKPRQAYLRLRSGP